MIEDSVAECDDAVQAATDDSVARNTCASVYAGRVSFPTYSQHCRAHEGLSMLGGADTVWHP